MNPRHELGVEPLDSGTFARFGEVIDTHEAARSFLINGGQARRYDRLALPRCQGGRMAISVVKVLQPAVWPVRLVLIERHRLGSQAWAPMRPGRFLVVAGEADAERPVEALRVFLAGPGQGVNYAPGTWHHPLLALDADSDFLVVDRIGDDGELDCDEIRISDDRFIVERTPPP